MAKLSLSNVLYNRRRMNYLTLLCALLLVFFLGSILIAKNPNKTKAAVVVVGTNITINGGCSSYYLYSRNGVQTIETDCPGPNPISLPVDANLTLSGPITVITYSSPGYSIKVNSLTITGGAKLTHNALSVADAIACDSNGNGSIMDSTDPSSAQCISARSQKVDITAAAGITLSVGGNIDVYAKGYPGGKMTVGGGSMTCVSSYGPGRGGDCLGNNYAPLHSNVNDMSGAGGSFGGLGNIWVGLPATNAGTTYNYISSSGEIEFGSGGQAIAYDTNGGDYSGSVGGAGGGRVKLKASQLTILYTSYIDADGGFGSTGGDTQIDITGGGGSGGAVVIDAQNIDMTDAKNSTAPAVTDRVPDKFNTTAAGGKNTTWGNLQTTGYYGSSHYGSDGVIRVVNTSADLYQITAQGGRACGFYGGQWCSLAKDNAANYWTKMDGSGGGGGWIVVQSAGDVSGVSINKSLSPVSRTDGSAIFNPYALKMGDIITVTLNVVNMTVGQTYTITDEFLSTKNVLSAQSCDYQMGSDSPSYTTMMPGSFIVWRLTAVADKAQFAYNCKVGVSGGMGDPVVN